MLHEIDYSDTSSLCAAAGKWNSLILDLAVEITRLDVALGRVFGFDLQTAQLFSGLSEERRNLVVEFGTPPFSTLNPTISIEAFSSWFSGQHELKRDVFLRDKLEKKLDKVLSQQIQELNYHYLYYLHQFLNRDEALAINTFSRLGGASSSLSAISPDVLFESSKMIYPVFGFIRYDYKFWKLMLRDSFNSGQEGLALRRLMALACDEAPSISV